MTAAGSDPRELAEQVDGLLAQLLESAPPALGEQLEELVRALAGLYGAGLERLVEVGVAHAGDGLLRAYADDELVGSLLAVHDLHPDPVADRVQAALDKVRPFLGMHAGDIALVDVDDEGIVHLQLQGSCDGCPSSALTVNSAIEDAVLAAAPEVMSVQVAGMVPEPAAAGGGLLQIQPYQPRQEAPGPCPVPAQ